MNYGACSIINDIQRLAIQIIAESQICSDIGKKCTSCFICLFNIIYDHAYSWLVQLIINDAGNISLAKEDPNGEIQCFVIIFILNQYFDMGMTKYCLGCPS